MTTSTAAPSRSAATTWAGRALTRRQVLGAGLGAGLALYGARAMPAERVFEAAAAEAAAAPDAPVLVSVFLPGGVDLLDTLVPLHDYGRYADLHPKLKIAGLPLGGAAFGVHPVARSGARRRRQGPVRARQDRLPAGHRLREPGPVALPLAPLLGDRPDHRRRRAGLARALARPRGRARQPAAGAVDGLGPLARDALGARARGGGLVARRRRLLDPRRLGRALRRGDGGLRPARRDARRRRTRSRRRARRRGSPREWPTGSSPTRERDGVDPLASTIAYPAESDFGERLRYLAAMIQQPLGIRVADVEMRGDFDTHDNQAELGPLLAEVSQCLAAFQADLEARGVVAARPHLRVVGVRPPARGERHAAPTTAPAASPGCRATGRCRACTASTRACSQLDDARQPQGHDRLPARLLEPARAVARHRRERGDPALAGLRARAAGPMRRALVACRRDALALAAPAAAAARPTAVGVGEREWRIALYRPWVPAGLVKFNVRNFGEDGHDLVGPQPRAASCAPACPRSTPARRPA